MDLAVAEAEAISLLGPDAISPAEKITLAVSLRRDNSLGNFTTSSTDIDDVSDGSSVCSKSERKHLAKPQALQRPETLKEIVVSIPRSTLLYPQSSCDYGFEPPAPEAPESSVIEELLKVMTVDEDDDYLEIELRNFSVYVHDSGTYGMQFEPLTRLMTSHGLNTFYFDGCVSHGGKTFFLRHVEIAALPIGGYLGAEPTVGDQIWLQSALQNKGRLHKKPLYYKLTSPSIEYARFYTPFLWVADLAKHVIDYLHDMEQLQTTVSLWDFISNFYQWLLRRHGESAVFQNWHRQYGHSDFRTPVVANISYIWKEAFGLSSKDFRPAYHRLWKEVLTFDAYKKNGGPFDRDELSGPTDGEGVNEGGGKQRTKGDRVSDTIVTPYIYDLFEHLPFGNVLQSVEPCDRLKRKRDRLITSRAQAPLGMARKVVAEDREQMIKNIIPGVVISTPPDTGSPIWEDEVSLGEQRDPRWFGLVQSIYETPRGKRMFHIIWLYRPRDTPCGLMKYPWKKELFVSDHCTCEPGGHAIPEDDILDTHLVQWGGGPEDVGADVEFFARQTYSFQHRNWTTLKRGNLRCEHQRDQVPQEPSNQYNPGDTVLADLHTDHSSYLEPCEVLEYLPNAGGPPHVVRLRRLLRRRLMEGAQSKAAPNDLVYSVHEVAVKGSDIRGRCLVRCYRPDEEIPTPYNRNGVGNAFVVSHIQRRKDDSEELVLVPIDGTNVPASLRQGFDPSTKPSRPLRGLDLFCGCGNFGRGLEDGGAVKMEWANDIDPKAVHSYMANVPPGEVHPFVGSVDDLLHRSLVGQWSPSVPCPGQVEFISGGSPCQGFSLLTTDKTTKRQRKNQSLIASFAAFVDTYRPLCGCLENVPGIIRKKEGRVEDVYSQLICSVVGLGYQAQVLVLDTWNYGSPQTRTRVFLSFAAPVVPLPAPPRPSHSTPPGTVVRRGLGRLANGEPVFERFDIGSIGVPFEFVSAYRATSDLPDIQDGKADICVRFPDHRIAASYSRQIIRQVRCIPVYPYGLNFIKAWKAKRITPADRHLFPPDGVARTAPTAKGWGRVIPSRLFTTVSTQCMPSDARIGRQLHWCQMRPLSVMEARRAQGFPDHDVVVGNPASQWHFVGNSVPRQLALALGLAIRESWFGSLTQADENVQGVAAMVLTDAATDIERTIPSAGHVMIARRTVLHGRGDPASKVKIWRWQGGRPSVKVMGPAIRQITENRQSSAAGSRKRSLSSASVLPDVPATKRSRIEINRTVAALDLMEPSSGDTLHCGNAEETSDGYSSSSDVIFVRSSPPPQRRIWTKHAAVLPRTAPVNSSDQDDKVARARRPSRTQPVNEDMDELMGPVTLLDDVNHGMAHNHAARRSPSF